MRRRIAKEIKMCDVLIVIAFLCVLGTRMFTMFYIANMAEQTQQSVEKVLELFEANPVARLYLNLTMILRILTSLVVPAGGVALYWYFRDKTLRGDIDVSSLSFFCIYATLLLLLNVANDFAVFLGNLI